MERDLLTREFLALTARPARTVGLETECALRIAAATLRSRSRRDISAVSVVVPLGLDDVDGLRALVAGLADEFGLLASVRPTVGACAVRFSRREPGPEEPSDSAVKDLSRRTSRA